MLASKCAIPGAGGVEYSKIIKGSDTTTTAPLSTTDDTAVDNIATPADSLD
jgi:hypothetical protein